jgi:2-polyprenyl-3-methyl-5-hydroxy-6-metoxy-1,4-benzoquinol methylase
MPEEDRVAKVAASRILFRRDLITGTLASLLGADLPAATVLDIGCSCGFFSLDIADRGAKHVQGVDLRPHNIRQAQFLAECYGVDNVRFEVSDIDAFEPDEQWDVVMNLGVLYHVTDPLRLMRRTYELCRTLAVVDTICRPEPVSAFFLRSGKDVNRVTEGRESFEFHPSYRAAIDAIRYAGFSDILEVVGVATNPHKTYARGDRRCFLAIK